MLQWLKKIVPEPRVPDIGGSSPGCTETAATRASLPAPQNPRSPSSRFTPHSRGHRRQAESASIGIEALRSPRDTPFLATFRQPSLAAFTGGCFSLPASLPPKKTCLLYTSD